MEAQRKWWVSDTDSHGHAADRSFAAGDDAYGGLQWSDYGHMWLSFSWYSCKTGSEEAYFPLGKGSGMINLGMTK